MRSFEHGPARGDAAGQVGEDSVPGVDRGRLRIALLFGVLLGLASLVWSAPTTGAIASSTQFCAEGSVRPGFQMYLSVYSDTAQTANIEYFTNKGIVSSTVDLAANQRTTVDVNADLTGPGKALDGQTDVDTSVKVWGVGLIHMACEVYFNSSVGAAGSVSGGHVQVGVSYY